MPESAEKSRVLVVEDEALIAAHVADMVSQCGYRVVGPVPSVRDALTAVESKRPDAALLDGHLVDGSSAPVARALRDRGVPFFIISGNLPQELGEEFASAPYLGKILSQCSIADALRRVCKGGDGLADPT